MQPFLWTTYIETDSEMFGNMTNIIAERWNDKNWKTMLMFSFV